MAVFDAFLLANYTWVQDYCRQSGGNEQNGKRENFQLILNDFPCAYAIDVAGLNHSILEDLGNKAWITTLQSVMTRKSISIMEREEYPLLLNDPVEFLVKRALPKLYERSLDQSVLEEKSKVYHQSIEKENEIFSSLKESGYDVRSCVVLGAPLDLLADFLRGTKGLLTDLHSVPGQVDKACEVMMELALRQARAMRKLHGLKDLVLPLHLPTLLSRKDFTRFYHPSYERLITQLLDEGFNVVVMVEGNADRFVDLFARVDSPQLQIHFESSDLAKSIDCFKGKKTQITGFYPTHLLKYASEKECLQKAKEMKRIIGTEVNYIFSTDKVLLCGQDTNMETLKKVYGYFTGK